MNKNEIATTSEELFKQLLQLNVNDRVETKKDLAYLSWAWAWQEFKKACPTATYSIKKFTNPITGITLPYLEDPELGFMVFTEITALGQTHEMWLPVMDGANKAMRREAYEYTVGRGGQYEKEKLCEAATMFDVNKAIMRCLVKNIAMFGLGLYIYAGEDLPQELDEPCAESQLARMRELDVKESGVKTKFKVNALEELTYKQAEFIISAKEKSLAARGEAK